MADLHRIAFFRAFPAPALAMLAKAARWRGFEPGQSVLEAGDPARDVCFIAEGEVRVIARSSGGHEMILNELRPEEFFGEIAAIDGGPRSAGVLALTRARICMVSAAPFMRVALSTPEVALQVMRLLAGLVRDKDARLLELVVMPVRPRVISLLLRLARPREGGGLIVSPPRTHQEIASRIGARREVVTRTLGALHREGLIIAARGGFLLPDAAALHAELGQEAASRAEG